MVLILLVRSRHCGELNRGSQNLELPERETDLFFSLVRKEPKVPQRFANLWTPGRIQSSIEEDFSRASGGTCRTRLFAQDGSEKALNRCEVPALQRKDLERRLKERPYSLRTVGYGWVELGDGGQKRVAWDGSKESFGQRKSFWFMEKVTFEDSKERFVQKKSFWFVE